MAYQILSSSTRLALILFGFFIIEPIAFSSLFLARAQDTSFSISASYRMTQLDDRVLRGMSDADEMTSRIHEQIDMVYASHLPKRMLDRVLRVPIIVAFNGQNDSYKKGLIWIDPRSLSADRPILLHEYLHALHEQMLPDGFHNAKIISFYNEARVQQKFPPDAYMFKNPIEFFAMTASAVLYGTIQREPFTRERVQAAMPEYYVWLKTLFDAKNRWN